MLLLLLLLDLGGGGRNILGDPGAVSRAGRKGVTKVFKHRRKSPWVPTLTGPFPNGQANAGSWLGTKNALCIIVPNRRTVPPELFWWLRTRPLLSRHSCPVRSPSFPNQTKELPMSRRFGRYQQEQFNLQWENSVSEGSQCIVNNRKFKMRRRQEIKNSNSLTKQNNNFARASRFYISLPSLRDYHVKMPSFTFCEGRKQAMSDKIFFLFMNLDMVDRNSAPEEFACIWQSKRVGIITIET